MKLGSQLVFWSKNAPALRISCVYLLEKSGIDCNPTLRKEHTSQPLAESNHRKRCSQRRWDMCQGIGHADVVPIHTKTGTLACSLTIYATLALLFRISLSGVIDKCVCALALGAYQPAHAFVLIWFVWVCGETWAAVHIYVRSGRASLQITRAGRTPSVCMEMSVTLRRRLISVAVWSNPFHEWTAARPMMSVYMHANRARDQWGSVVICCFIVYSIQVQRFCNLFTCVVYYLSKMTVKSCMNRRG